MGNGGFSERQHHSNQNYNYITSWFSVSLSTRRSLSRAKELNSYIRLPSKYSDQSFDYSFIYIDSVTSLWLVTLYPLTIFRWYRQVKHFVFTLCMETPKHGYYHPQLLKSFPNTIQFSEIFKFTLVIVCNNEANTPKKLIGEPLKSYAVDSCRC